MIKNRIYDSIVSLTFHVSDFQLLKVGFVAPSPIQSKSWRPIVIQIKDAVAVAKTGFGKTRVIWYRDLNICKS